MNFKESIHAQLNQFLTLCKSHNIKTLHVFGSFVNGSFNQDISDVDLLIDIEEDDPIKKGTSLISIWDKFEVFFKRRVDLLTYNSIKNPVLKKNIDKTKVLVYDGRNQQIFI